MTEVTQLLKKWNSGDQAALEELIPHVYKELHQIARHLPQEIDRGEEIACEEPGNNIQSLGPMASWAPPRPPNVSEVIDFGPKEMRASVVSIMIVTIILENRVPVAT